MLHEIKWFFLFATITLSFLTSHSIGGMDELLSSTQGKKTYAETFLGEEIDFLQEPQLKKGKYSPFLNYPKEITLEILKYAADTFEERAIEKLPLVCKEWQSIIKNHENYILKFVIHENFSICKKDYSENFYRGAYGWCCIDQNQECCERFLNGNLVYKPNEDDDNGKIELWIADLPNPLEGTFDLSQCGDAGNSLSISTGYRKGVKSENKGKVEVWFVPRSIVMKEIKGNAKNFEKIFPEKWPDTAPIGIIWTSGEWYNTEHYEYLTSQNFDDIPNDNLYKKWEVISLTTVEDIAEVDSCLEEKLSQFILSF